MDRARSGGTDSAPTRPRARLSRLSPFHDFADHLIDADADHGNSGDPEAESPRFTRLEGAVDAAVAEVESGAGEEREHEALADGPDEYESDGFFPEEKNEKRESRQQDDRELDGPGAVFRSWV